MGYIFDAIQKAEADNDHNTIDNPSTAKYPAESFDLTDADHKADNNSTPISSVRSNETTESINTPDTNTGEQSVGAQPADETYTFVSPEANTNVSPHDAAHETEFEAAGDTLDEAATDYDDAAAHGDEAEDDTDASHLLRFQNLTQRVDDRMVAISDPSSMLAEEYRGIRTRILAGTRQRRLVHTITSASRAEGKTLTSLNLACVFGEMTERRTIVIEGDLRVPTFRHMLKPESSSPGLIQYLKGEATLDEIIQPLHTPNLSVIYAGGYAAEDALQLLSTNRLSELLAILKRRYDHVIVDTPPVLDVADAGVIGAQSDDVFLMLRMSRTSRRVCEKAIETLRAYNAPVAGVVLTDVQSHAMSYGYKYGYKYAYGRAAA